MKDFFDKAEKIAWVKGLLVDCPMGKAVDDCPAKEFRKTPLCERMKLVNEMSEEDMDLIIQHHGDCISRREG